MQCKERVYSARGSTPAIGGEGVCCEEKIRNIKNMTPTVQGEEECNTRRVASVVSGNVSQQMVGIPMGTNCAPLLADLFLYSYENEFLDKLIKEGKRKLARKFNLSYSYIDDLISFNNKRFKEFISDIYPKELTVSETTESTSIAS